MDRLLGAFVAVAALTSTALAQEKPAAVWWSTPVEPGELVQVHGGAWGTNPVVEVTGIAARKPGAPQPASAPDFRKAQRVQPVKVTETGVCFEYPRSLETGLAACRIVSDAGVRSDPFILNEPVVWWLHGDRGGEASPGGWLRLFGRCLSRENKARVVLTRQERRIELMLTKTDVWSLDADLPSDLPTGDYAVYAHNGSGGPDGWRNAGALTVRPHQEVWKTDRFDVARFGAIPNDGLDDTLALQAALALAATNGGGIVYLPRGRFQCNGTLQIPERTLLRGESRETTSLYWPDCEEPPENLIEGTSMFGIEDLFIHAGKYRNGIVCKNEAAGKHELGGGGRVTDATPHDITVRRVRLKLLIDQYLIKNTAEYEKRAYLRGNGLVIRDARFVRVEDCDLYTSKEGSTTLYFVLSAEYLHIRNCRINGSGWAVVGGDKVIFENNDAYNCTYSVAPVCRNLYWGNNRQHDLFTNNRESITHDGARTAFRGLLPARCEGTRLTLDFGSEKVSYRNGPDYWVGQNVQLVEGRGAGQTRTITALTNSAVTIDRPWAVAPDATSRFVVAAERQHLLYVDNTTEDSSIAIQLYGGLTDGVLARNRCARSGGFRGFGMDYHGIIPLWFVQYLDNEILEGSGYRGPSNEMPPRDSVLEFSDHGNERALTRSCVIRRGLLHNNARIEMASANGIVENCLVRNADTGISVSSKHAASIVLRGNRFENVAEPLDVVARQQTVMRPAERVLVLLAGAEAVLGDKTPAAWKALKKQLASDLPDGRPSPTALADAQNMLLQALRALSAANGPTHVFDVRVAEALLGASLRIQSWDSGMTRLLSSASAAEALVTLQAGLALTAPETTCKIAIADIPGWRFPSDTVARLSPGTTSAIKVSMSAPAGAKGFFRLPVTVEYSGDGWSLKCRDALQTLTENRLCQWVAAGPFSDVTKALSNRDNGQALTNANVHGALSVNAFLSPFATGSMAVAVSVLRVARPTPVRFNFSGPVRLYVDGTRIGTDIQRGTWGGAALAPGDHVLKAVVMPVKKDAPTFKVSCEIAETCLPGDLTVLTAAEVLSLPPPSEKPK
jgi:hypothetical protein